MIPVTKAARDAIMARLAAPGTGFNDSYADLLADYPDARPITLDFDTPGSNVFLSSSPVEAIIGSTARAKLPVFQIYTTGVQDEVLEKGMLFSGTFLIVCAFHMGWPNTNHPINTEDQGDAIAQAFIQVINNPRTQSWGSCISWNGRIGEDREPVIPTESPDGWLMTSRFTLPFIQSQQ